MKANASKHKAMSYKRMKEEETRLEGEVVDKEEGKRYGKDKRGDELPLEFGFQGESPEEKTGSPGVSGS